MSLTTLDLAILVVYFAATILIGFWVSRRASRKDLDSYFLGGKTLALVPARHFRRLGHVRHQRHDGDGLLAVRLRAQEHLAAVAVARVQPDFHDGLPAAWLRRSNVLTGAEWIQFRFGAGPGRTWRI